MIQTIDLRTLKPTRAELLAIIPRPVVDIRVATEAASNLIAEVRAEGSSAIISQAERFDRVTPHEIRVPEGDISAAINGLDPEIRRAIEGSIERVRIATAAQVPAQTTTQVAPGARIVQRWQPVDRAGLYVPGGKAVLASSVIMNVVPAQIAGVRSIALASPSQKEFGGGVHPTILATAGLLGVDEVYAMGGAGAIGALAYGVPDIGLDAVDIVTGPGNIYVAAAKRLVKGVVGIDAEAGTTEIIVIADATADARYVAADLVSQAEHDEAAASLLVTDSAELAVAVERELAELAASTAHSARVTQALGGPQSAIVLVDDIETACQFSNLYAPEHLEIHTKDPGATLELIDSAGAIFLGSYSPVSLGDYLAGSNHVLPTGGQVRFASGLGAFTFLRPQQIIEYDRDALAEVNDRIFSFANAEALPAHGDAVAMRFDAVD